MQADERHALLLYVWNQVLHGLVPFVWAHASSFRQSLKYFGLLQHELIFKRCSGRVPVSVATTRYAGRPRAWAG